MKTFLELIEELDKILKISNAFNYQKLYPGVAVVEIDYYFHKLGIEDEYLRSLYSWKGGYNPDKVPGDLCQIMEFDVFLSMEAITGHIEANKTHESWEDKFIPLVTDTTGQFILFNTEESDDYGKLYLYSTSLLIQKPISYYDSIYKMIETVIEEYKQGALVYDRQQDWLNCDIKKIRNIAGKINIKSDYWRKKG